MFVSGFVSIVGRPNVGKSTLINSLLGRKLLIVSDKPQTTRNRIQAILTAPNAQIIFLDTPGIHKPKDKLGDYMVKAALEALKEVELVLFMVEATSPPGPGDSYIASLLRQVDTPVFLVINKMDLAPAQFREEWLFSYLQLGAFQKHFLVSALQGENLQQLLEEVIRILPPGPLYYPADVSLDRPEEFLAAEIIREKIFWLTSQEIPYATAVTIESISLRENRDLLDIRAVIYVEKESQKGIIIGKNGEMLKKIGTAARQELENLLGNPVFLHLWVKVKKDWRSKENTLRQLGYE